MKHTREYILCAAIWYQDLPRKTANPNDLPTNIQQGVVITGHRHANVIATLGQLTGLRSVTTEVGAYVQGFLTNRNRFVDRKEAARIATEAEQLLPNPHGLNIIPDRLYSEDLY